MTWIDEIERRIRRWRAQGLGGAWVAAVSGGGDSVGLLRLLNQIALSVDIRLSVAHLDHGARGEASRADAEFVAEMAASLRLPFDLGRWEPVRAAHFEADARRARYEWLIEIARDRGADVVAVGHTRDDQVETILHRILRGTGIHGLSGIPRSRILATNPKVNLVRPLLAVSRRAIREYLSGLGQAYREDPTNTDLTRTRSRIRQDLLPKLAAEYNPRIADALVRLGEHAVLSQRAIEADALAIERATIIRFEENRVVLKHAFLSSIPDFLRIEVLRRVWRRAGWPEGGMSARRWRRLAALIQAKEVPRTEIGAGVSVVTERVIPGAVAPEIRSGSRLDFGPHCADLRGNPRCGRHPLGGRSARVDRHLQRIGKGAARLRSSGPTAVDPTSEARGPVRSTRDGRET